jgi:hypothetical protein
MFYLLLFDFNQNVRIKFQMQRLLISMLQWTTFEPHDVTKEGLDFGTHKLDSLCLLGTVLLGRPTAMN